MRKKIFCNAFVFKCMIRKYCGIISRYKICTALYCIKYGLNSNFPTVSHSMRERDNFKLRKMEVRSVSSHVS